MLDLVAIIILTVEELANALPEVVEMVGLNLRHAQSWVLRRATHLGLSICIVHHGLGRDEGRVDATFRLFDLECADSFSSRLFCCEFSLDRRGRLRWISVHFVPISQIKAWLASIYGHLRDHFFLKVGVA